MVGGIILLSGKKLSKLHKDHQKKKKKANIIFSMCGETLRGENSQIKYYNKFKKLKHEPKRFI